MSDLLPDFEQSPPPYGSVIDLPFEFGDEPEPSYGDVASTYDPDDDWRDAQAQYILATYGDDQPFDEEATDG